MSCRMATFATSCSTIKGWSLVAPWPIRWLNDVLAASGVCLETESYPAILLDLMSAAADAY